MIGPQTKGQESTEMSSKYFKNSRTIVMLPVGQDIHAGVPSLQTRWNISLPVWRKTSFHSQRICFAFQATLWAVCMVPAPMKTSSSLSAGGGWSDRCQALSGTPTA